MQKLLKKLVRRGTYIWGKIVRNGKYRKYFKKYGFAEWHMVPKISKPYIKDIINYIKLQGINENTCIVECGCGLCDILMDKNFKRTKRIGVERDKRVYDAICEIYTREKFINGSFQDIRNMKIDWFIAVNFTHEISDGEMSIYLKQLVEKNEVKNIILDEVSGNYRYKHQYTDLIPEGYLLKRVMGPYQADGGERYICVFGKS